ncbi:hypothetical protein Gasu2_37560 [Galdieria sulphuraria]|uniref:Hpc2-related domain-containing protein n=1 Tax=Galdieria sulphuraria TaxID=130081 RepID=M2XVE2_GALSU|nr:uncharacterized protein Gasu_50830 [Galdieria sulphuraria]EME27354.1 hypothetical protein Gasu_50830 [Galdieria sulphuraria]GJD09508.1 hypothetical protein Gasu2_37560 [Galdieria sulphuraria]|eukprot:XP_005703874.1 hypothetical protein Gasu_50830 [Galdieria sulphuraria]
MAISIKITPGETNRVDLKKVERVLREEKPIQYSTPEPYSTKDNLLLPKGLDGVVAKYSKINKKSSRSTRDDYDMNDDFIDDSEAVELFEDVKEELEQDFYICSEELEELFEEERIEPSSARERSNSLEDSFSEHSQIPTIIEYTYEEICEKLEPIPEAVKSCIISLKEVLESSNLSRRSFTSTYVASYIKNLFVTGAQYSLAQKASFGENGAVRCYLSKQLWSHIKALFNCKGLSKYRCSKKNFEEDAFSVFHSEWKHMVRNEKEEILSDLKHALRLATDSHFEQRPLNDSENVKGQDQDSYFSMNSHKIDSVETQTQGSEGAEEDISASPARRCKRKAATMAAEEISNLAVHGSTQSPLKKKKLRIEWSESIDKLVYNYFVKKLAQIRCRDLGKSKKNESAESATELLNAAFSEYDVTEKDLIDAYRRHKAEIKRSQRQKSKEKREEIKRRKELAAQKKWEREQNPNKHQAEQPKVFSSTESKGLNHIEAIREPDDVKDTLQNTIPKVHVTSVEKNETVDTLSNTHSAEATSVDRNRMNSSENGVVGESTPLPCNKTHGVKPKLISNSTPKPSQASEKPMQPSKVKYKKSDSSRKTSNAGLGLKKEGTGSSHVMSKNGNDAESEFVENACEISQNSKSKPKKHRSRFPSTGLNEKIFKKLASISETPSVGQRRIPAGFAAEVEAAVE